MEFMNTTLTTKDLILACTPLILAVAYFIMNTVTYINSKKKREFDPETYTPELMRVTRAYFIVSIGVLLGVTALYIIVITLIKLQVFT